MCEEMVSIQKKRLDELLEAERILAALHAAGVDNWDGYEMAFENMEDDDE